MDAQQIVIILAVAIVGGILAWGVITMGRGGAYNLRNSNRIMRYRVIFQAIAILAILAVAWLGGGRG